MLVRLISFLLLLFAVLPNCDAQCLSGDCKNGKGKMDFGYAVYEGSFKNGLPEGEGTMDYGGGDKYVGGWHLGKEDGKAVLYKKGTASEVFYKNGVLQTSAPKDFVAGGNGDYIEKPAGCIFGDCINGYGEIHFESGNKYKGGFKAGVKSGAGEMTFASGNVLKGTFVNNNPVSGSFWYNDVQTFFVGSFNADGLPKSGTYTSKSMDGIVDVRDGRVISERHPRRDSLNAIAAKHALEYGPCKYCEGKGEYLNTSYSSMSSKRTETKGWTPTGGYFTNVEYKTTGGFSQSMVKCPKCKGTGEIKR